MNSRPKKKIWNGNVRDAALSILMEINNNQAYSNLLLHRTIEKYGIETKDRGLLTELTYGTLQHRMALDYYLEPFVRGKLDGWVRELLRMSLYQIVYLTKIPPHAVVHEAVEIAKDAAINALHQRSTAFFVPFYGKAFVRWMICRMASQKQRLKQVTLNGSSSAGVNNLAKRKLRLWHTKTIIHLQ